MKGSKVGRVNQQSKGETPLISGVLQRAAVRAVADKDVEATEEVESGRLRESRFRHDFSQVGIDRGGLQPIQAKLTIGEPGDKYEQEADRVASQVVQQINTPASVQSSQGQSVQRTEAPEEEKIQAKQENTSIQRMEAVAGVEASTDLDTAINSARGSGQPLDVGLQRSMRQAMGVDFSGVKVHTDAQSDKLNQSIQAKAFTTGQEVFFRQGEYNPGSRGGQELIAHELTHVVQQNGGNVQRSLLEKGQEEPTVEGPAEPVQVTEAETSNQTGIPDALKAGVEKLSGYSLDDVRVNYNSPKPAQFQALAYTKGTEIQVARGQEAYLPHEAWHVVQQMQGRVKGTQQVKGKQINEDEGLEREADVMGKNAINIPRTERLLKKSKPVNKSVTKEVVQKGKDYTPVKVKQRETTSANKTETKTGGRKKTEGAQTTSDTRKQELIVAIEKANEAIKEALGRVATFKTDKTFTSMNPAVYINELPEVLAIRMTRDEARLANISSILMEFVNKKQTTKATPEVQTAIIKNSSDSSESIYFSGNTRLGNEKIQRDVGEGTMEEFYQKHLRPIGIRKRKEGLIAQAKSLRKEKGTKKELRRGALKGMLRTKAEASNVVAVSVYLTRQLLAEGKRNKLRRMSQSVRKWYIEHRNKLIKVPKNPNDIHAESAILESLSDTEEQIKEIGGTKVACEACQAYFTKRKSETLLGDYTGYAWLSASSFHQLMNNTVVKVNEYESYLIELATSLKDRLNKLKRYTGSGGTKKIEDASSESDIELTDSEDDEAMWAAEQSEEVNAAAKEIVDEWREAAATASAQGQPSHP